MIIYTMTVVTIYDYVNSIVTAGDLNYSLESAEHINN